VIALITLVVAGPLVTSLVTRRRHGHDSVLAITSSRQSSQSSDRGSSRCACLRSSVRDRRLPSGASGGGGRAR
jgi:hypothetical protein